MQNQFNRRKGRQGPPVTIVPLPGQVSFRIICHVSSIGGFIGNSGAVVSQLRRETNCRIHCEEPVRGSDHRVILIVGSGSVERRFCLGDGEECEVSCAQEAMVRVFERVWEVEADREWGNACDGEEEEAYCGLLADTTQIGAVVGRQGKTIVRMRTETGAKIRILPPPQCGTKNDELIQITGGTLAVKKALVAVSACLQSCPPLDREPTPMSIPTVRPSRGASPDPHKEFFPHLSSLLPPMPANSVSAASSAQLSPMDAEGDSNLDSSSTQKEVVFRILCSNSAAGAIIGKKGAIVRAFQNQTGASIMFATPVTGSGERVVTISALENIESWHSPAQNAVILVFARSVEADIEKGLPGVSKGDAVTVRLLVASDQVSCLNGKEGRVLAEIIEVTGADVRILDGDLESHYSPENVVEITGEYQSVQNAIFQVTSKLRDYLLPPEGLREIRERNCYGTRETGPSLARQPTSSSSDTDQGSNLAKRMHPSHSENTAIPRSLNLQPKQTAGNGHSVATQDIDRGLTTFGGSLDHERSLDFLLPHELLNEVGGRSPSKGRSETTSGLLQSLGMSLDSDQENALRRAMGKLGLSDSDGSTLKSQILESVRKGNGLANPDGKGGLEIESVHSGKKSAVVKNTTVEMVVPEDVFGSIYGKNGCNLARLKEISGAKVEVHDPSPGETEGIVFISGSPDQTLVAQSLLQAFIQAAVKATLPKLNQIRHLQSHAHINNLKEASIFYSSLIRECTKKKALAHIKATHSHMIISGISFLRLGHKLVEGYLKCGRIFDARKLFDEMPERYIVTCNSLIASFVSHRKCKEALGVYQKMVLEGVLPDDYTFSSVFKVFSELDLKLEGRRAHGLAVVLGWGTMNAFVGSALVDMYVKFGNMRDAKLVLDRVAKRDVVLFTALIVGCSQQGEDGEALEAFRTMIREGIKANEYTFASILISCGNMGDLTTAALVHNGREEMAFSKIRIMIRGSVSPNSFTLSSVLRGCASLAMLKEGQQIHAIVTKFGLDRARYAGAALIDLYGKCGSADMASYAQNGFGHDALNMFNKMQDMGLKPNDVTYVSILLACNNAGLVEEGCHIFSSIKDNDSVELSIDHYACMVGLLGRSGRLEEAETLLNQVSNPDVVLWRTLLSACKFHGEVEMAERIRKRVLELSPADEETHILLSNLYASKGKWSQVIETKGAMKEMGLKKNPAMSWVDVNKEDIDENEKRLLVNQNL
ncbi:hypothetical protein COLO4_27374 [Corchorus olitorius]|uniref:K Homology domain-containing protein n=1 Tax=Corchorus olitorius TaxID=93759 RepID=A0A1R3HRC7_9ROSI|nr:hypothetical protein COLO4_27374 [Corchorus olitorius]